MKAEELVGKKVEKLTKNRMDSHGKACGKNLVIVDGREQTLFFEGNVTTKGQSGSWVLWAKSNPLESGYETQVNNYLKVVTPSGTNSPDIYAKSIQVSIDGGFVYLDGKKEPVECNLTGRLFEIGIKIRRWVLSDAIVSPEEALAVEPSEFINFERNHPTAIFSLECSTKERDSKK